MYRGTDTAYPSDVGPHFSRVAVLHDDFDASHHCSAAESILNDSVFNFGFYAQVSLYTVTGSTTIRVLMIYLRLRFMGYVRFRFGERFIDFLFFRIEIFFIFFMDFLIEVEVVHAVFYQVAFLYIGSDGMS